MNSRLKFTIVTASAFLVALLLVGAMVGKSASPDGTYRHLAVYTEVLSRIKSEYVEEPDLKAVTLGALNGLLESIDPFASYLSADQYKEYVKNKDARKGDVGLVLSKRFGYIGVLSALPGSPAAKAGLTTGDVLENIKGISTRDMPLAFAGLLLRGEPGSTVEVGILRVRHPEPQTITLTRTVIQYPNVTVKMLPDNVGYLQVRSLIDGRVQQVSKELADLKKQGAKRLVLDLRQCATGAPEDGIGLANLFLDSGLIAYVQGQRVARQNFQADPAKDQWKLPVSVIVNRGTAGGCEVAAGALLEDKRAQLVGERTYGDASVRRVLTLEDGSAIILSVAKYYSPSGKAIQDTGVTPQNLILETAEPGSEGEEEPETPPQERKPQEDALLIKAIELVKQAQ